MVTEKMLEKADGILPGMASKELFSSAYRNRCVFVGVCVCACRCMQAKGMSSTALG